MTVGRPLTAVVVVAAAAGVVWSLVLGVGPINYDSAYSLLWGEQIAGGTSAERMAPVAPTPKPLLVGLGLLPGSAESHDSLVLALAIAALAALAAASAALAATIAGRCAAALTVVVVLTREPILSFGLRAYVDVLFAALVTAAVVAAAQRRADRIVLLPLAVAGTLRPEAWLLAVVWLAARWRSTDGERALLVALAAAGPLAWVVTDLALGGGPLDSWTGTRAATDALERRTGLDGLVVAPRRIGEIVREPVIVAVLAAGALHLRHRDRATAITALTGGLLLAAFTALTLSGLPALGRYLIPLAVLTCVVGCSAIVSVLRDPSQRTGAAGALAAIAVLVTVATTPAQVSRLQRLDSSLGAQRSALSDLRVVVDADLDPPRCRPIRAPNHRLLPHIARRLQRPVAEIRIGPGAGTSVLPTSDRVTRAVLIDPRDPRADLRDALDLADSDHAVTTSAWTLRSTC